MLDDVTKKRINSLRQILVGKLPDPKAQVEQITNGLIYKFMNDMDEQSVSMGGKSTYFSGKFQKYSWNNLMNTKTSGVDRIKLYSDAIEQMYTNENLPELFREIFKNSFLPFKDPSTLNMFLKEINEFHYSNSEKLGDAFEYLLSFMGSQGDAGQFRTPRHIIDFITEIVNPQKNETLLDPACGTAGFLISAYKHILKQNTKKNLGDGLNASDRKKIGDNLNGYDISPDMVKMSLVNMYLHKFTNPKINEYDTLSSEDRWNEYYDVILANPPFFSPKGGITPHKRFGVNSSKAEVLFIDYINEHLKPNGRAGIIVPEGIIFQSGTAYKQLRKTLVETSLIAVISLPAGIFQPYSMVKTSILILDKKLSKINKDLLFLKVDNDGYSLSTQRNPVEKNDLPKVRDHIINFINLNKNKLSKNNFSYSLNKLELLNNEDVSFNSQIYHDLETKSDSKIEKLNINEYVFFQEGPGVLSSQYTNSGYPLINVKNVRDGYLDLNNTKFISKDLAEGKWKHFIIEEGDILFTTSGTIGRSAIVKKDDLPLSLNTSVVRFKSKNEHIITNKFLFCLLRSKNFVDSLLKFQTGSAQKNVGPTHIKKLLLPIPSLDIQNQLVEEIETYQKIIDGSKMVIENYKPILEIDKSWDMINLENIADITSSKRIFKSDYVSDGIPFYRTKEVAELEKNKNISLELFISKEKFEEIKRKYSVPKKGEILVSAVGTVGITHVIDENKSFYFKDGNLLWIRKIHKNFNPYFIKFCFDELFAKKQNQIIAGSAYNALTITNLKKFMIPKISKTEQDIIVEKILLEKNFVNQNKTFIKKYEQKINKVIDKIW